MPLTPLCHRLLPSPATIPLRTTPNVGYNAGFITASTGMFQDPGADTPRASGLAVGGITIRCLVLCARYVRAIPRFRLSATLVYRMLVPSCSARRRSAFTAGDRTQWLLPSSNSTDRIASQSVKERTSISFSLTNITHARQTLVSTSTRLPFAQRNTSQVALAICPVLITLPSNLSFPPMPLAETTQQRSAFTLPTTMCSA